LGRNIRPQIEQTERRTLVDELEILIVNYIDDQERNVGNEKYNPETFLIPNRLRKWDRQKRQDNKNPVDAADRGDVKPDADKKGAENLLRGHLRKGLKVEGKKQRSGNAVEQHQMTQSLRQKIDPVHEIIFASIGCCAGLTIKEF
jgi:hypothetical protein